MTADAYTIEAIYNFAERLVGPGDFACTLDACTLDEHGDASWSRDGINAVTRLNEQHRELERLRVESDQRGLDIIEIGQTWMARWKETRAERDAALAEVARLTERQQVHLEQIRNLSQSVPLDSEVADALAQRGALLAGAGTLRNERDSARADLLAARFDLEASRRVASEMESERDEAVRNEGLITEQLNERRAERDEARREVERLSKRAALVEPLLAKRGNDFADGLVETAAEVERMRPVVEAAVAMRWIHEGCVVRPPCGLCIRCQFDRAIDARLAEERAAYEAQTGSSPKEHCPLRLAGIPQERHSPCDTGDFSRDGTPPISPDAEDMVGQLMAANRPVATTKRALEPAPIDVMRFTRAPCYLCGYNGEGYYQPETHPCSTRWREEERRQYEKTLTPYWSTKPPAVDVVGLLRESLGELARHNRELHHCTSPLLLQRIDAAIAALEGK